MKSLQIERVELRDVGPFSSLSISFPVQAGLNLVCGDNGIGKSTLLEAIVAAFSQGQLQRLKRRQAADGAGSLKVTFQAGEERSHQEMAIEQFGPDALDWVSGGVELARSVINIRAARDFGYLRQVSISRDPSVNDQQTSQSLANGLVPEEIKTWFSNRWLFRHHAEENNWSAEMRLNLEAAIGIFSLLDPSVRLAQVDTRTFDILVATPSGIIPFEYLSSGFRSAYILLLGIIKEIEFRALNVAAHDFSGIIIIDEVELHLHPSWQRAIGNLLKTVFPSAQIIATTHSPHVIQSAQAAEVVALVRDPSGGVITRTVPSTKYGYAGWTLEEVLEDIMGVADTRTPEFREAMSSFDSAVDEEDPNGVVAALDVLNDMLHPTNPLRKLLEITAAPYIGAADLRGPHR